MSTLKERLEEVMELMRWSHADLVRVSGQSSSVVSQWLGKGSKEIKSIKKMEAALAIEKESGFSALWVAEGKGPRHPAKEVPTPGGDGPKPPPLPPLDFKDRRTVSPEDWELLESVKLVLSEKEILDINHRADVIRMQAEKLWRERVTQAAKKRETKT